MADLISLKKYLDRLVIFVQVASLSITGTFLVTISLTGCAATGPAVKDVTELAPPVEVHLVQEGDNYLVEWQASYHKNHPDFAGYNIYMSRKSLILAPIADLPAPVLLDPDVLSYRFENTGSSGKTFVHVRSRNSKGEISLPSLPELIISK